MMNEDSLQSHDTNPGPERKQQPTVRGRGDTKKLICKFIWAQTK